MRDYDEDGIVRFVNTFTVSEWETKKHVDKNPRRGITRVSKSNSQSVEKLHPEKHRIEYNNDENHNAINQSQYRSHFVQDHSHSTIALLEKVQHLENELGELYRQKIQWQAQSKKEEEKEGIKGLIESHYITCKEDLDELIKEKSELQEKINTYQQEASFMKLNMSIQEQYILQVQLELNNLRDFKRSKQITVSQYQLQTDEIEVLVKEQIVKKTVEYAVQYSWDVSKISFGMQSDRDTQHQIELNYANMLVLQLETKNKELKEQIYQLQSDLTTKLRLIDQKENSYRALFQRNDVLVIQIAKQEGQLQKYKQILKRQQEQLLSKDQQISSNTHRILVLEENREQMIETLNERKEEIGVMLQSIDKKNEMIEQRELVISKLQMEIITNEQNLKKKEKKLQLQYQSYKKQLDSLVIYLEQQSDKLKEKEQDIERKYESSQLICMKNEEALRKQTQIEAIVVHYEDRIKRIQGSLEEYMIQLMQHRKNDKEIDRIHQYRSQQVERLTDKQEKLHLMKKIEDLQSSIIQLREQNHRLVINRERNCEKTMDKQQALNDLREQILYVTKQYEKQAAICSNLKQQNLSLYEKIQKLTLMKQDVLSEIQAVSGRYQKQINDLQCHIYHIESDLRMQIQKNAASESSFDRRIDEIKKDYDILYNKYMKYKNLAKVLEDKKNHRV